MADSVIIVIVVASALVLLVVFEPLLRGGRRSQEPYASKPLMTRNEREFISRLERALPECRIHSQVCMGALVKPSFPEGSTRKSRSIYRSVRNRFAQKMIDFVVEERATGRILTLVELDDSSHNPYRDSRRDAITMAAGYRTIRWKSRFRPAAEEIRARVLGEQR